MNNEYYMQVALEEAREAKSKGGLPFGAVIVKDDKIISKAHSREHELNDVTVHAETQAVSLACRKLGLDLSECTIYASGEPCNMCAAAIFQAKIPRVVIGASRVDLPHIFRQREIGIDDLAHDSSHSVEIIRGVGKAESIRLFSDIKRY